MDQVGSSKRHTLAFFKGCFIYHHRSPLVVCSLGAIGGSNKAGLAQIILAFEILDFGGIGTIQGSHGNGEYGVSLVSS